MLSIKNNKITLTRGDTAEIEINLDNYQLQDTDSMLLTVKKNTVSEIILFQVKAKGRIFYIKPENTKDLKYDTYIYDVQLTTAKGDVYTVISPSQFVIDEEVTW